MPRFEEIWKHLSLLISFTFATFSYISVIMVNENHIQGSLWKIGKGHWIFNPEPTDCHFNNSSAVINSDVWFKSSQPLLQPSTNSIHFNLTFSLLETNTWQNLVLNPRPTSILCQPNPQSQDKHNTNQVTEDQYLASNQQPAHMETPSTSILNFTQLHCKIHLTTNIPSPAYPKPSAQPNFINTNTHFQLITIYFSTITPKQKVPSSLYNSLPSLQSNPLIDPTYPQLVLNLSHISHVPSCHPSDIATLTLLYIQYSPPLLYPGAPNLQMNCCSTKPVRSWHDKNLRLTSLSCLMPSHQNCKAICRTPEPLKIAWVTWSLKSQDQKDDNDH